VVRPRLRSKGDQAGEVAIPAYQRLRSEPCLGERLREILVNGVSTRKYETRRARYLLESHHEVSNR
jgi:hypothetical protein